jgi:hypothetical protein
MRRPRATVKRRQSPKPLVENTYGAILHKITSYSRRIKTSYQSATVFGGVSSMMDRILPACTGRSSPQRGHVAICVAAGVALSNSARTLRLIPQLQRHIETAIVPGIYDNPTRGRIKCNQEFPEFVAETGWF